MSRKKADNGEKKQIFSDLLGIACQKYGITQTQLSKVTGIRQPSISDYSQGISAPSFENLVKIVEAFGLTLAQFFSLESVSDSPLAMPGKPAKDVISQGDRELELLRKLEVANDEARKWRLKAEELKRGRSSDTDATETAFDAETPAGSSITESRQGQT